jgi:hypothetical protein
LKFSYKNDEEDDNEENRNDIIEVEQYIDSEEFARVPSLTIHLIRAGISGLDRIGTEESSFE